MKGDSEINFKEIKQNKQKRNKNLKNKGIFKKISQSIFKKNEEQNKNKKSKYSILLEEERGNVNQNIKKIRNPGVDFIRIIAMYSIILHHHFFYGNDIKYFPQYKRELSLIHSIVSAHNDIFILISGIVGYKTYRYSNLIYLWLTVLFYSVGINQYTSFFEKKFHDDKSSYKIYYPMIFERYWYFSTYFGMYLFLPVINKGIEHLTKNEFRLVLITIFFTFIFWKGYKNPENDLFHLNDGKSVIWFLIFYLTGAYIGKYRVDYTWKKKIVLCCICLFTFAFISYLYFKILNNEFDITIVFLNFKIPSVLSQFLNEKADSLLKIVQAITICLFFLQIKYNKYIAKIICFFGPLVFSVYLIHNTGFIIDKFIINTFVYLPKDIGFNSLLNTLLFKSLKMLIFCLTIDYLRQLLFTFLKIKKTLLYLESKLKEKLN